LSKTQSWDTSSNRVFSEVTFVEMRPGDGQFEPLLGSIVLEQSCAAVDMMGDRLVPVEPIDLK
jgi:hypothetical protein